MAALQTLLQAGRMITALSVASTGIRQTFAYLFATGTLLCICAGLLTLLLWPRLDAPLLLTLAACGLLCLVSASTRLLGVFLLAAGWAAGMAYAHVHAINTQQWPQVQQVTATIIDIPRHEQELSRLPLLVRQPQALRGKRINANWYRPPLSPQALPASGESWSFLLRMKPPYGSVNRHGFDYARWLLGNGVHATASIQSGQILRADNDNALADWRRAIAAVRSAQADWVSDTLAPAQAALARALLVGDRSRLDDATKQLLAATGTSHLLAISGLHVGLVALLAVLFMRGLLGLLLLLPMPGTQYHLQRVRTQQWALGCGLLLALGYALLSGLLVSTQRAMIMLLIATLALLSRRQQLSGRSLLLAAVLIVACNPLQLLSAGFWLSFVAVFTLWLVFAQRTDNGGKLSSLLRAQIALCCTMLMLQLALLQQFSLLMLPVNLLAIPLVSVLIMPCLLLAFLLHQLGLPLADLLLQLAGQMLAWLQQALSLVDHSAPLQAGWLLTAFINHTGLLLLAILGGFWLVLPRGMPLRWLALCLWLPILWPQQPQLPHGAWQAEVMDVGQGTAVLVRTARHMLVYDSGPGDNAGRDRIADIVPALAQYWQLQPERIVISHSDLDHAGGLYTLRQNWPDATVYSSDRQLGRPCASGQHWRWDGVDFTMLYPGRYLPYMKNNSSCVLLVASEAGRMLLSGDIDHHIERRLLRQWQGPPADVLLVPHHGSSYSSSSEWLQAVSASTAVVTAGQWNRFSFPRPDVVERYQQQRTRLLGTAGCGAISIRAFGDDHGISVISQRLRQPRWWQQVVELDCELNHRRGQ